MRDIIFRGIPINKNTFIFGSLLVDKQKESWLISDDKNRLTPVSPDSIGEYSGFNAKNGRIFEKDFLLVENYFEPEAFLCNDDSLNLLGEVVFRNGAFVIKKGDSYYSFNYVDLNADNYIILGNRGIGSESLFPLISKSL